MEQLLKVYEERPFTTEFGHVDKSPQNRGGITLWFCNKCDVPMTEQIGGYCALCGGHCKQTMLTVKQYQQRAINSRDKVIIIGHEDVKWWED